MIFKRNLIVLLLCVAQTTSIFISASCKAGGKANLPQSPTSNQPAARSSAEVPSGLQEKKAATSIRDIDFENLTYPWYPSYLNRPDGRRELELQNGTFDVKEDMHTGLKNLHVELENVSYADLEGNGQQEAIITLGGVSVFNRFVGAVFVYAIVNGKPSPLWQHEIGDRADGGLRRIVVDDRTLIIEEYARSEGDGGLCCPKKFSRSYYRLNRGRLTRSKSELLPSEFDYAKFLGYPGQSLEKPPK